MKLNVKTLKGTSFEIEANPEASVAEVKRIIETTQGQSVYPADQLMLIYEGKFLEDDTTLESNKVSENSFIVIMLAKTKASNGASTAAKAPAAPGIPENVEAPPVARAPASGQQTNPQTPSLAQPAAAPPVQTPAASVGPDANPLNLFPHQGVPRGGATPAAGGGGGAGAGALDALRQIPQFQALLALVQANPHILQPMLQELGKQNPRILRLLQENQAEFLRLVNASPEDSAGDKRKSC